MIRHAPFMPRSRSRAEGAFPFNKVNGLASNPGARGGRSESGALAGDHQSKLAQMAWELAEKQRPEKPNNQKSKLPSRSVCASLIFGPHCLAAALLPWPSSGRGFPHYLCTSTNCGNFQDLFVASWQLAVGSLQLPLRCSAISLFPNELSERRRRWQREQKSKQKQIQRKTATLKLA